MISMARQLPALATSQPLLRQIFGHETTSVTSSDVLPESAPIHTPRLVDNPIHRVTYAPFAITAISEKMSRAVALDPRRSEAI